MNEQRRDIIFPILAGALSDISLIDFSFVGIKIVDIQDSYIDEYVRNIPDSHYEQNMNFLSKIRKINIPYDKKYLVLKENIGEFNKTEILNCWKLLLIMFPSDLQIEHIIHFEHHNGFFQSVMMETNPIRSISEQPYRGYLQFDKNRMSEINEFVRLAFNRLETSNYVRIAIDHYVQSYTASYYHYSYLSLLFSLESVIEQASELSYRLKRFIAILCGNDIFSSYVIDLNISELYNVRSKIVHGGEMRSVYPDIVGSIPVLRAITSRTIIELLTHNIDNIKVLNKKLSILGYGEKHKLTEGYKEYILDVSCHLTVTGQLLKPDKLDRGIVSWIDSLRGVS